MSWEGFIAMEREQLKERREGKLRKALGLPLPGESSELLERIAKKDRLRAEQGLVSLKVSDGSISYKHIDDLSRQDMTLVLAAEQVEVRWLKERVERMRNGANAPPVPPHLA